MMRQLSAPVEVTIEVTNQCNLQCQHCYSLSGPFSFGNELTFEELIDIVDQMAQMGVFQLQLAGGEPFLRSDTVELIRHAKAHHLCVTCSTSGWFLTPATVKKLASIGIDNVQVSLDGGRASTHDEIRCLDGSFDRAIAACRRLAEVGIPLTIGSTLMRKNFGELPAIADIALAMGADALHIMGLQPGGRGRGIFASQALSDDEWQDVTMHLRDRRAELEPVMTVSVQGARFADINTGRIQAMALGSPDALDAMFTNCDCAKARCTIDSLGNVLPCDMVRLSDMCLRDVELAHAWTESRVLEAYRARGSSELKDCHGCAFWEWCRGGCAASAQNVFGSLDHADPRCGLALRESEKHGSL